MGFLVGIVTALLTVGLWTKKYLPTQENNPVKFFGYSMLVYISASMIILSLLRI